MKNTLFVATYFNNDFFVRLQFETFTKYIKDSWDFIVIDDSADDTKSLLSHSLARNAIRNECTKYNIQHVPVPQDIHAFIKDGGLVEQDSPDINIHHPTERHQALLRWILNNNKQLNFDKYKTVVILDADMMFKKDINILEYMENYDMLGAAREQTIDIASLDEDRKNKISAELKSLDGKKLHFYTMCLLFINMSRVTNLETFNNKSYRFYTDTGGKSHKFIENNPQYKFGFLKDWNTETYRCDFFSKQMPRDEHGNETDPEILHYRGGSAWAPDTREYYFEKLHRMLAKYLPDFAQKYIEVDQDVTSSNGEHTLLKNGEIISRYGV